MTYRILNQVADSVIDVGKLTAEEFKEFTHVYEKRNYEIAKQKDL